MGPLPDAPGSDSYAPKVRVNLDLVATLPQSALLTIFERSISDHEAT